MNNDVMRHRLTCYFSQFECDKSSQQQGVDLSLQWLDCPHHHFLTMADEGYPEVLRHIPSPPKGLFVAGDVALLTQPQLAMVGSRSASPLALVHAQSFAASLCQAGLVVTSGLALGVDGACHQGALSVHGKTIAVLGCGVDRVYPRRHDTLYRGILQAGAVVSEFPLGTLPLPHHFPMRNRIISGLSLAVLVVEASLKSGSLITARYALEQGRDVLVLPASIENTRARGSLKLIQEGAACVTSAEEVLVELGMSSEVAPCSKPAKRFSFKEQKLLEALGDSVMSADKISARSGLAFKVVCSMLISLELAGFVEKAPGGYQRRV